MAIVLLATAPHSVSAQAQASEKTTSEQASASAATEQSEPAPKAIEATYSATTDPPAGPSVGSATSAANPRPQGTKVGESTFQVYGFAMLDAGYDFKQNDPNWFDVVRPTKLPAFAGEFAPNGKTYLGVRQTRFGVKSSTPTKYGDLKTIFEFELFGVGAEAGETTFRLRHAYGELGIRGRAKLERFWSPDAFPNTVEGDQTDWCGSQRQFRLEPIMGKNALTIGVSVRRHRGQWKADRIELQGVKASLTCPISRRTRGLTETGDTSRLAGCLRDSSGDTTNDAVDLGGRRRLGRFALVSRFSQNNVSRFQISHGGEENYMNDAPVDVGIADTSTDLALDQRRGSAGGGFQLIWITPGHDSPAQSDTRW
jgi:hypothetical protein